MYKLATLALIAANLSPISAGSGGSGLPNQGSGDATPAQIRTVLGIVFGIVGALALLFIIISGIRYMLSAGDPQKAAKAREGIIYALVGLALAIFAETIVVFVSGKIV